MRVIGREGRWWLVALASALLGGCSCGGDDDDDTAPTPGCPPYPLLVRVAQEPAVARPHEPVTLTFRIEDVDGDLVPDDHYEFVVEASYVEEAELALEELEPGAYSVTLTPNVLGGITVRPQLTPDGYECARKTDLVYLLASDGGPAVEVLLPAPEERMVPGERRRIAAVAMGAAGAIEGSINPAAVASIEPVTWSTGDGAIASVDADGVVTAIAVGETTLTASAGSAQATVPVVVAAGEAGPPPFGVTELSVRLHPDEYGNVWASPFTPSNEQWRRVRPRMALDARGWPAIFAIPRRIAGVASGTGPNQPMLHTWSGSGFSTELIPRAFSGAGGGQVAIDGAGRLFTLYLAAGNGYESPLVIADRDFDATVGALRERRLDTRSALGDPSVYESEFADSVTALPAGGFPAPRVQTRALLGLPEGGVWVLYGMTQVVEWLESDRQRCERILRLARVTEAAIEAEDVERLSYEVGCVLDGDENNPIGPFSAGLAFSGRPDGKPTVLVTAGVELPESPEWRTRLLRFDWDGARWVRSDLDEFLRVIDTALSPTLTVLPEPDAAGEPRYFVRGLQTADADPIWASPSLLPGVGLGLTAVAAPSLDTPSFDDRYQHLAFEAGDGFWLGAEAMGQLAHLTSRGALRAVDDAHPYLFDDVRSLGQLRPIPFAAADRESLHYVLDPPRNDLPQVYARVPVAPRVEVDAPREAGRRLSDEPFTGYVQTPVSVTADGTRYVQLHEIPGDPDGTRRLLRSVSAAPFEEVYSFGVEETGFEPAFLAAPREVGAYLYAAREYGPMLLGQGRYRAEVMRSGDGGASWTSLHDLEVGGNVVAFLALPGGGAYLVVLADLLVEGDLFGSYQVLYTPDVDQTAFAEVGTEPAEVPLSSRISADGPSPPVALLADGDGALLVASIFDLPTQTWDSVVQRWGAAGVLLDEVMADRDRGIAPGSAALLPDGALLVVDSSLGATYSMGLLRSEDLLATVERVELGDDIPGFILVPFNPTLYVHSGFGPLAVLPTGEIVWGGSRPIGQDQVQAYLRVSRDGGRSFEEPRALYATGGRGQILGALAPDPEGGVTAFLGDNGALTAQLLEVDPRDFLELRVQP